MSAIANMSAALGYDAAEAALASGASLASVLAAESARFASFPVDNDTSPDSTRAATIAAERPTMKLGI